MKKSLVILMVAFACSATLGFAADKHEKSESSPKSAHDIAVGNEKAAGSGNIADYKAVREENTHAGQKHEKSPHEMAVGNEKAAGSGNTADDKSVRQEKTHAREGKHKSKGHSKK
jgi:hypothetical protein